jgi:hypothetical protein
LIAWAALFSQERRPHFFRHSLLAAIPPLQPTSEWSEVGREEEHMALSKFEREAKLQRLAELEGFETVDEMFDAAVSDSVCPGICINPGCDYTADIEPDQRKGYCENCGTQTVQSCLVLAGLI